MADFGTGVSRTLSATARSFETLVWQKGKPPLDSELNLNQQIQADARSRMLRSLMPSGFLGDAMAPERDFVTNSRFSNLFYFGSQAGWDLDDDGDWVAEAIYTNSGTASISSGVLTDGAVDFTTLLSTDDLSYVTVEVTSGTNAGQTFTVSARGTTTLTLGGSPSDDGSVAFNLRFSRFVLEPTVWAHVNGWVLPITGTETGSLPLSPNDTDTRNRIQLYPPPTAIGTMRTDFVFLEVWQAQVSPNPSTDNKPSATELWKHGNVLGGMTPVTDDLIDPAINFETTERVQVQYRIRVVSGVDLTTFLEGFDTAQVFGRGTAASDSAFTFANMKDALNDPGLWRAGDGDPSNSLNTVDGYTYAVPICAVFRRNSTAFGEATGNLNGGFNGNGGAATPDDAKIYTVAELTSFIASLDRPDKLRSDQVANTDVLDLRHQVSPSGFDYEGILKQSLMRLMHGRLRSTWKRSFGGYDGPTNFVVDQVLNSALGAPPANITGLDGFDGKRRIFSDAALNDVYSARAWVPPAGSIPATSAGISDANDGTYDRTAGVDILAQSRDDQFHATLTTPANYMPTTGNASTPALAGTLEPGFDTWAADIFRFTIVDYNGSFSSGGSTTYTEGVRFVNPGDRYDYAPEALSVFIDGSSTEYKQNGFTSTAETAGDPDFWCTGPIIDGSHDGLARSVAGLTGTISDSGSDHLFTFDATQHGGADADAWPTPLEVGQMLTIGNPADVGDNGSYEILEITSTSAPVAVRLNRVNNWSTAGAGILWDRSYAATDTSTNLVVRLSNNFPNVDSSSLARKLRMSASLLYSPGRGLSRRPIAVYDAALLNITGDYLVSDASDPVLIPRWFRMNPYGVGPVRRKYSDVLNRRVSPFYVDMSSKTVMIQPWQVLGVPGTVVQDGAALHGASGLMPLKGSIPTQIDAEGLFGVVGGPSEAYLDLDVNIVGFRVQDGTATENTYVALDVPVLAADQAAGRFGEGLNFFLPEHKSGSGTFVNSDFVWTNDESNGAATYLSFATRDQAGALITFGDQSTTHYTNSYMFSGMRHASFTVDGGTTVRGLELPWYFGPGRLWAIYERTDYIANGSNYDATTRAFTAANSTNLLVTDEEIDTLWFSIDNNGDGTFIIPEKLISGYSPTTDYIIECSPFAFDRNFMVDSFRILPVSSPPSATTYTIGTFQDFPTFLVPQAPHTGASARIRYTTAPYQGDINGTQEGFLDRGSRHGQVLADWIANVVTSPVDTTADSLLSNPTHFEVLGGVGFITALGTGSPAGPVTDAPASSLTSFLPFQIGREERLSPGEVQLADPAPRVNSAAQIVDQPPTTGNPSSVTRWSYTQNALGGSISNLPLGVFVRDYNFYGGILSSSGFSTVDLAASFAAPPFQMVPLAWGQGSGMYVGEGSTGGGWDIFPSGTAEGGTLQFSASLKPGDVITLVDGNSDPSNISDNTQFRTNRGKAVFISDGDTPGAPVEVTLSLPGVLNPSQLIQSPFVSGVALLVRSLPERVGSNQIHHGDELQMVVLTTVSDGSMSDWRVAAGATNRDVAFTTSVFQGVMGIGEGYSACDRFRLAGHPLVKGRHLAAPNIGAITLASSGSLGTNLISHSVSS